MRTTADERLGSAGLAAIDTAAEAAVTGLTTQDAYPVLRAHLALCAVAGRDPAEVLREALASPRGLDDARDVAAVLDWRIHPTGHHSTGAEPLPWLPTVPEPLRADLAWGPYLDDRARKVTELASAVATRAGSWTPASAPLWARPLLDQVLFAFLMSLAFTQRFEELDSFDLAVYTVTQWWSRGGQTAPDSRRGRSRSPGNSLCPATSSVGLTGFEPATP
jgi:hypothetical protein